jgi:RNA recognition motif-containing protein
MEAMNGKCIGNLNRSIRVMIAASRDQGSKRDSNEEEKTQRLFVVVPKTMTDSELYDYFKIFGDVDYATIMRDRETRESKGFAYVKYFK